MERRRFLAATGLAASSVVAAPALACIPPGGVAPGAPVGQVQFTWDGLALTPREYAAALTEAVADPDFHGDNYSLGGQVTALEQKFAKLLGKEAAIFVPTGTLANHLAIRKLAGNDRRVLVQAESHFYNDSGDCAQTLSDLNLVPLATGKTTIELDEIKGWVARTAGGRVETRVGVISIESPMRRSDHAMFDFAEMQRVSAYAREQGIRLHLDGARLFNLPLHSGKSLLEHTTLFDTVYVSLWKHFNAGSGAILAGDARFIEGLYHQRRMFGGALPRAWPETAVVAKYVDTYEQDYAASWRAADALIALLQADGRVTARKVPNGTSRFYLKAPAGSAERLLEGAQARGIGLAPANPDTHEFTMQVNPSILRMPEAELAGIFIAALGS